jgi:hypothetical protein
VSLQIDIGAALRVARTLDLVEGGVERVQKRATVTLLRRLQAETARVVPRRFNVAAKLVRPRLTVKEERPGVVQLIGSGNPLELHVFGGEYGGRLTPGASAQISAAGERRFRLGSFIRKNDRLKKIMTRAGTAGGGRVQRLPIKVEYGADVGSMLLSDNVAGELLGFGRRILEDEVARLVAVELRGL